jgi:hypothetical protein
MHISNFVRPAGRLNITKNNIIIKNTRKIIYPGAAGDFW